MRAELCDDRHIKDSRVMAAAAAVLVMSAAVATSSAQTVPPIPTPPIPNPPTVHIPGEKVVKFKLVFDGTSKADRVADIGGQTGGCDAHFHDDIQEDVSYGRGKGVTMEFVRFKQGKHFRYGFQRSGRRLDSSFNVVATINRTASGAGDLVQHPGSVQCSPTHFEAGQNPDCGTRRRTTRPGPDGPERSLPSGACEGGHHRPRPLWRAANRFAVR
jgi:hypothetical protein